MPRSLLGLVSLVGLLILGCWYGDLPRAKVAAAGTRPIEAEHGLVVTVSAPASDVGLEILRRGGNAVDAAVATAFALAVTYPAAGNIGGGGFMVVHPGGGKEPVVIEYREA